MWLKGRDLERRGFRFERELSKIYIVFWVVNAYVNAYVWVVNAYVNAYVWVVNAYVNAYVCVVNAYVNA